MRVLTIHGWAFCPEVFKNLPPTLEVEHHSITYEGNLEEEARRVAQRIDENTILIGWSMGATIGVLSTRIKTPKGLVLIGATPHFARAWRPTFIKTFLEELERNFTEKVEEFRKSVWGGEVCKELPPREGAISFLKEFIETDISPLLENLKLPTLLVHGRKDPITPYTELRKMLKLNPRFEAITYDGGHFPKEFSQGDWEEIFNRFGQL